MSLAAPPVSWLVHESGVDTRKESRASQARALGSWAFLVSRLADAALEPAAVKDDRVQANPDLYVFRCDGEAIAYRFRGIALRPQVVSVGSARDAIEFGAFVAEAQRRMSY